jgi:hypothetical protein
VKKVIQKTIAMLLWAVTAFLAGYEVFLARHIIRHLYLRLFEVFFFPTGVTERLSATAIGNIAALVMSIIAIAIVVGGFDYHWTHGGERRSLKVFAWTFLFEFIVLGIYVLIQ